MLWILSSLLWWMERALLCNEGDREHGKYVPLRQEEKLQKDMRQMCVTWIYSILEMESSLVRGSWDAGWKDVERYFQLFIRKSITYPIPPPLSPLKQSSYEQIKKNKTKQKNQDIQRMQTGTWGRKEENSLEELSVASVLCPRAQVMWWQCSKKSGSCADGMLKRQTADVYYQ